MYTLMIIVRATFSGVAITSQLKDFETREEADAVASAIKSRQNKNTIEAIKLYV